MSLRTDRKPVEVCLYSGRWLTVTKYVAHRAGTLEYVHPVTGHKYLSRKGNWREVPT